MSNPEVDAKEFIAGTPLYDPDQFLMYTEMFDKYASSEMGKEHAQQALRYAPFHYARLLMSEDFGTTVSPVEFMRTAFSRIATPMLEVQVESGRTDSLEINDIKAIRLATILHGIGESESSEAVRACGNVVGSKTYFEITPEEKLKQQAIRKYVYASMFPALPSENFSRVEEIISGSPVDFASNLFSAVKMLMDYENGIKAAEILKYSGKELERGLEAGPEEPELHRIGQVGRMAVKLTDDLYIPLRVMAPEIPYVSSRLAETERMRDYIEQSVAPIVVE